MRAIVFTGGEGPAPERARSLVRQGDLLIAADSGLRALKAAGLEPSLVAGDMDSVDPRELEGITEDRVMRFPHAKDESDTELCLRLAWERGCDWTAVMGGGGGRLDHLAALLGLFERVRAPNAWYLRDERATRIEGEIGFSAEAGTRISILPLGSEPLRMKSSGLRWPLDGLEFPRGFTSLSNEAAGGEARIVVESGKALLVTPYGKG